METDVSSWLPFLILFRLGSRFITLLDPVLGLVLFYNTFLFQYLPGLVALIYPLIMGAAEVYLVLVLGRGKFPVGLLLAYFMIATVFEFPYASLRSGIGGITPFALMWYLSAPLGLFLTIRKSLNG
jgi:hypothetical protein